MLFFLRLESPFPFLMIHAAGTERPALPSRPSCRHVEEAKESGEAEEELKKN